MNWQQEDESILTFVNIWSFLTLSVVKQLYLHYTVYGKDITKYYKTSIKQIPVLSL